MKFAKTSKTYDEQITLLRERGLHIESEWAARHHLCNVSYYRLSAYFVPFQLHKDPEHIFKSGATFDTAFHLYIFDRELRLIAMDAIEQAKISSFIMTLNMGIPQILRLG
jgi:abortive infection bacteriophage resistance protein